MKLLNTMLLALCLLAPLLPNTALAGFEEGNSTYMQDDYVAAMRELTPLAERGHAIAQKNLGVMYAEGQAVSQDFKEALKWYRLSADQGNATAQNNLGWMFENGYGVPINYLEAAKWYRSAADQSFVPAQQRLRNLTRLVAAQGNVETQIQLADFYNGNLYRYNEDYWDRYADAVTLYRLAARQGNSSVQFMLGYMYFHGRGVEVNYPEAAKWYRLAADQGHDVALRNLAFMYRLGQGVNQNENEARRLMKRVCKQLPC